MHGHPRHQVYQEWLGGRHAAEMLEAKPFLDMLHRYGIPVATASALPEKKVLGGLQRTGLKQYFDTVVTAEDGGATEVEWYFMYAAQQIQRPPMRCIVIGESNTTVEAAHELGMKCIIVAGNTPVYNFTSADLVVRNLSELSFHNLKKLFGEEALVEPRLPPEGGEDGEPESSFNSTSSSSMEALFDDDFGEEIQEPVSGEFGRGLAFYR